VTRQKYEIKEGLVKYNNFVFWWKPDSEKYGANFRKYWRMRRALKDGVLDFYVTTFLIIGGFTIIYGLFKGRGKSAKEVYQERVNEIKMKEIEIEMEKLKL
jgi:hypothetical protein